MGRELKWQAQYANGQTVNSNYRLLDRRQVIFFDVLFEGATLFRLDVRPDVRGPKRWFWRQRSRATSDGREGQWFVLGWSRNSEPQLLIHVFDDGSVLVGTELANDVIQDKVEFFEWE